MALPTVMRQDVEIGDVSIHYRQAGAADAAPVLLLHGGGSDGGTWEPMFAALTAIGMRVVAPDLRGHGRSSWAPTYALADHVSDARQLCQALGLARTAVVGHSLGIYAACLLAQSHPGHVTKLVLEEPPAPNRVPSSSPSAGLSRQRMTEPAADSAAGGGKHPAAPSLRPTSPGHGDQATARARPEVVDSAGFHRGAHTGHLGRPAQPHR